MHFKSAALPLQQNCHSFTVIKQHFKNRGVFFGPDPTFQTLIALMGIYGAWMLFDQAFSEISKIWISRYEYHILTFQFSQLSGQAALNLEKEAGKPGGEQ